MRSAHDWGRVSPRSHRHILERPVQAVSLLLVLALAVAAAPAAAQSYRIYGLPDTLGVGESATVYGLALNGSGGRCPACSFATTDPSVAVNTTGNFIPGWGSTNPGAHVSIVGQAPGTTVVYGAVYRTGIRFRKTLVVVSRAALAYIQLFCGVTRCPSSTTLGGPGTSQQVVAYGFDKNGNVLWSQPAPH